jgi:integration host factor subunit beta
MPGCKKEAATIVDLFFGSISEALAKGDRVEIRGLCTFFVKNINPTMAGIPSFERPLMWLPKNCHFLSVVRN